MLPVIFALVRKNRFPVFSVVILAVLLHVLPSAGIGISGLFNQCLTVLLVVSLAGLSPLYGCLLVQFFEKFPVLEYFLICQILIRIDHGIDPLQFLQFFRCERDQ